MPMSLALAVVITRQADDWSVVPAAIITGAYVFDPHNLPKYGFAKPCSLLGY